jgi:hypothetical protein
MGIFGFQEASGTLSGTLSGHPPRTRPASQVAAAPYLHLIWSQEGSLYPAMKIRGALRANWGHAQPVRERLA